LRLHTVNQPPTAGDALATCLRFIEPGDCLLLLEDGVYAGCSPDVEPMLQADCTLLVLEPDADARGLPGRLHPTVQFIDYAGFVDLAARCDSVISWY
jgi:tRNA 2-thiouridine synthesizing protein B